MIDDGFNVRIRIRYVGLRPAATTVSRVIVHADVDFQFPGQETTEGHEETGVQRVTVGDDQRDRRFRVGNVKYAHLLASGCLHEVELMLSESGTPLDLHLGFGVARQVPVACFHHDVTARAMSSGDSGVESKSRWGFEDRGRGTRERVSVGLVVR